MLCGFLEFRGTGPGPVVVEYEKKFFCNECAVEYCNTTIDSEEKFSVPKNNNGTIRKQRAREPVDDFHSYI